MILVLFVVPLGSALVSFLIRRDSLRRGILLLTAVFHFLTALWLLASNCPLPPAGEWFGLDGLGKLFLLGTSFLFLAVSFYARRYLKHESSLRHQDAEEGFIFRNNPEAFFTGCLLLFLAAMSLVITSRHFGMLWVGMEATTLVSAPLIYFHKHHRSLEAAWKYLLICSVGIALALIGNLFLAVSASTVLGGEHLTVDALVKNAALLSAPWLKASFIFILIGFGTKMGLAPCHAWLPDAHSEAPSLVSALLSGALLNCAFLGILRIYEVTQAAGLVTFMQGPLVVLGLFSMFIAVVFILGQADYKRMLAYSSVEHMGIMALALGIGGSAIFAGLFHVLGHSLAKGTLFLTSGNILERYKTKTAVRVTGLFQTSPLTGVLWIAGFLAISGSPPFGTFLSEFWILKSALERGRILEAVLYLGFLTLIFFALAYIFLGMIQGTPKSALREKKMKEPVLAVLPQYVLIAVLAVLGLWMPGFLRKILEEGTRALGGF